MVGISLVIPADNSIDMGELGLDEHLSIEANMMMILKSKIPV